ncbi:hypothetical protein DIJ64_13050 [Mycobacterium leprae]|uniref:Uncharacterized protein MLCB12.16 n=1 Tax=Mycobacterium leprae TaxID=1769 RepID=Q9Z5K2_MYCLR|nr:hypothetical protein [Mycobacterium leprae]AWV48653.1 hypothetical protein DIJ64_13050 [Mycobacterium leprae]OAR19617.1 hypothetical protein A8144_13900 [Mycobacterium leprae 3125609]OAX70133.1 hypothetical protein A3216_13835 [Mycobacterium leprae 7935681]CAB36642.1 hypothetical protein [Mycobacterium leprae]
MAVPVAYETKTVRTSGAAKVILEVEIGAASSEEGRGATSTPRRQTCPGSLRSLPRPPILLDAYVTGPTPYRVSPRRVWPHEAVPAVQPVIAAQHYRHGLADG